MGKVSLKLDESNDLNFEFRVQGASSEPGAGSVQFRFVIAEKDNPGAVSYIYPVKTKEDNGTITVSVHANKNLFSEGVAYTGKVEVIIGTRLLVPTIMEIEFIKPLKVEIQRIESVQEEEEKFELESVVSLVEGPKAVVPTSPDGRTVTLTKTQLQAMIQERAKVKKSSAKKAGAANPSVKLKDSMKKAMKSALED